MNCLSGGKKIRKLIRELFVSAKGQSQRRYVFETDSTYLKSSLLSINAEENCPISGTLTMSTCATRSILKMINGQII